MKTTNYFSMAAMLLLSSLFACTSTQGQQIVNANAKEFNEQISLEDNETLQLIDVRTPGEYSSGHLSNSKNINFYDSDFKEQIAKLDKSKTVYVYCRSGGRSGNAARMMADMGFVKVVNMSGGVMGWSSKGLPLE